MRLKRIVVLGISGSGKTTFARKLGKILNLRVFFMDQIFWQKNWQLADSREQKAKHAEIIAKPNWIIEGYAEPDIKKRLMKADLIIWLDYSGLLCAWRGIKRWWQFRGKTRPEMANGCIEKLDWKYIWTMLHRLERRSITAAIKSLSKKHRLKILHFKSPNELNKWMTNLSRNILKEKLIASEKSGISKFRL